MKILVWEHSTTMEPDASVKYDGRVVIACPGCAGRPEQQLLDTTMAAYSEIVPGGVRWVGVRCPSCGNTYTIEGTQGVGEGVEPTFRR